MIAAAHPVLTLPQVAQMAGGDLVAPAASLGADPPAREAFLRSGIDGATIDTRALQPGQLFVPLPGSQVDGHQFLDEAFRRGAAAALCDRDRWTALQGREPGPLVVVDDVTAAFLRLAHRYRERWTGLLLAVTGSAGKTTTKDLVAAAFASAAPTLATEGNLNNHWGVPLTLMRLRDEHRAAVVEIGMNHAGEIAGLAAVVEPGAGVITNAGSAHLEHLGSLEAIAHEKAQLGFALAPGRPLFAGAESPRLLAALSGAPCRVVTYGTGSDAQVHPRAVQDLGPDGSRIDVEGFPPLHLRLVGRHQIANALAALAVAREFGLDPAAVVRSLETYRAGHGRMEIQRAHGAVLLVDCYNANPESARAALETLAHWPAATRRIAVLGDMLELGAAAPALHRESAAAIGASELWSIGAFAADYAAGAREAGAPTRVFSGMGELSSALREALAPGVVVLLKASRGASLERALEGIEREGER
jgi:UDP-N-acetylmuramoyl-tripeptide--D-alanyl-D-alanine ligase